METKKLQFEIILLIFLMTITGCSHNEETSADTQKGQTTNPYFPLEVGRYWKYSCSYQHGTTSSNIEEINEYEVTVQIIAKNNETSYEARIINDPCNVYQTTLSIKENGDIYSGNKIMISYSNQIVDPNKYKSIFNFPIMSGGTWISTGNIEINTNSDMMMTTYVGKETKGGSTTGTCEHDLSETFEKGIGMTQSSYIKSVELSLWSNYYKKYIHSYSYSNWEYSLIDYGIDDVLENEIEYIWIRKNNVPTPLSGTISFTIDHYGYVGIGEDGGVLDDFTKEFYKYDPNTDQWEDISPLPINANARKSTTAFALKGKGYICGGKKHVLYGTEFYLNDFWEYSPNANSWKQLKDFPRAIIDGVGFSIGSIAYVGLGITTGYKDTKSFYKYDATSDTWSPISEFPGEGRRDAFGFSMDGKGYVGLGQSYNSGSIYYQDIWEYNPSNDKWTRLPDFPGDTSKGAIGYGKDGYCYIGMGFLNELYVYDINTKTWSSAIIQQCMDARTEAISFMINNKIYYGSGKKNSYNLYSDLWEYTLK